MVAAGYPLDDQSRPSESVDKLTEGFLESINYSRTYSLVRGCKNRQPRRRRPSLVGSFQEFYDQFRSVTRHSHEPPTLLGTGGYGCVYAPPINCRVKLSGRFVGKVFKWYESGDDDTIESETMGAKLMAQIDPTGEFHTRLIASCMIDPPSDCEFEVEQTGQVPELIYEHGGTSINDLIPTVVSDPIHRLWFYIGLERFLGQLEYMVAKEVVHLDTRTVNVVVDPTYRFRLIDFSFVQSFSEFDYMNNIYYPRELALTDDRADQPTLSVLRSWNEALKVFRESGTREFDTVMELNGMTEATAHARIKDYLSQIYMMSPTEQRRWVIEHIDSHTFGITLAAELKQQAEEMYTELRPVLYHLLAYNVRDRNVGLARHALRMLIDSLMDQIGEQLMGA